MNTKPSKVKILMVCLGNIWRSPLAHGILQHKLKNDLFEVDSAGTAAYHIGNSPDYRSINVAKQNSIDIKNQKARQFTIADFNNFDIIYAMDASNYNNIINLAKTEIEKEKVKLILNENAFMIDKNVPDPYYGDVDNFEYVFKILDETCNIIANKLTEASK